MVIQKFQVYFFSVPDNSFVYQSIIRSLVYKIVVSNRQRPQTDLVMISNEPVTRF